MGVTCLSPIAQFSLASSSAIPRRLPDITITLGAFAAAASSMFSLVSRISFS